MKNLLHNRSQSQRFAQRLI